MSSERSEGPHAFARSAGMHEVLRYAQDDNVKKFYRAAD
jgi:hypothetical protein